MGHGSSLLTGWCGLAFGGMVCACAVLGWCLAVVPAGQRGRWGWSYIVISTCLVC